MTDTLSPLSSSPGNAYGVNPLAVGAIGPGEIVKGFERPSPDVVARLAELPIANISDAMNKHGVMHTRLRPLLPGTRVCGPALTCNAVDLSLKVYALSLTQPGDVFVLAAGEVEDFACFGEMASTILLARGGVGAIVDGAARDLSGIREAGLPVFARAVTPRNYYYPFGQPHGSVNVPVTCGGVTVNPGDVIVAGDDGIVVVPRQVAAEVAATAEQVEARESAFRDAIHSGEWEPHDQEQQLRAAGYAI